MSQTQHRSWCAGPEHISTFCASEPVNVQNVPNGLALWLGQAPDDEQPKVYLEVTIAAGVVQVSAPMSLLDTARLLDAVRVVLEQAGLR